MRFILMAINFFQDFRGNKDQNTIVFHKLRKVFARFIRILPQSWYGHVSMQMEFYGCPGRRIILNLKQSPLPEGTVIIYRQGGGGGQWFLERSHSFQGEKEEKGWSSLTQCRKGSQKIAANVGDYRNTVELYGRIRRTQPKSTDNPPPPLLPFPPPKPRSLKHTKKDNNDNKKYRNT